MKAVGVRELKSQLSRHLKRVRGGTRIVVTERGRPIATIVPIEMAPETSWAWDLVAKGQAQWAGGKPSGTRVPPRLRGVSAAAIVIEERR